MALSDAVRRRRSFYQRRSVPVRSSARQDPRATRPQQRGPPLPSTSAPTLYGLKVIPPAETSMELSRAPSPESPISTTTYEILVLSDFRRATRRAVSPSDVRPGGLHRSSIRRRSAKPVRNSPISRYVTVFSDRCRVAGSRRSSATGPGHDVGSSRHRWADILASATSMLANGHPLGKLALSPPVSGVRPCPVSGRLDVGTNNGETLLDDPLFSGRCGEPRRGDEFRLSTSLSAAVTERYIRELHPVGGFREFQRSPITGALPSRPAPITTISRHRRRPLAGIYPRPLDGKLPSTVSFLAAARRDRHPELISQGDDIEA